ncbi:Plant protein of unknown function [Forsythia ovata]|uniref:Uncharacterized protein n=1 Tax=Forsythia ovata TaxID=205694 RepID=A0ABD1UYK6_9LAMI
MRNLDQIQAIIRRYGPTVLFHPREAYLPSSVSWFFKNGALLYRKGDSVSLAFDSECFNLPREGTNDREYWIDLPTDGRNERVKHGNLENTELYHKHGKHHNLTKKSPLFSDST